MRVLGLDTSNYTTSCAVFDGAGGVNRGRILDGPPRRAGSAAERRPVSARQAPARAAECSGGGDLPGGAGRGGGKHPPAGGGGLLYAMLPGGSFPGAEPCPCAGRPILCLFSPAGASGRGGLVRRTDGPAGPPFPGLAPVRRHHGAVASGAGGGRRGRPGRRSGWDDRHLRRTS